MAKVLTVVGNRPQFIKLGVTERRLRELGSRAPFESVVVNTGQHYDTMLSDVFFKELQIEAPKYNLGIGSGPIVDQVGKMLSPLREIITKEAPDAVLVYGDTNSTLAAAIVAAHHDIPLIHVEGGERLYRRAAMPEEINRIVADHLADLCLASSRKAVPYLLREGFSPDRVEFVGDPMYDIFKLTGELLKQQPAAQPGDYGLEPGQYVLATLHRAENTDSRDAGLAIMDALDGAPEPILLPAHPRLAGRLDAWGWKPKGALRLTTPLGYFDFQSLLRQSRSVVTDSGGVGREAFFAGKGAIVPLESSAWIEPVVAGMAIMVGSDPHRLADALMNFQPPAPTDCFVEHEFGEGDAGTKIIDAVHRRILAPAPRSEGPWHPVARFADLPRVVDAMDRTHKAFSARLADALRLHGRIVLDLSASLLETEDLCALAEAQGVQLQLAVPLERLAYNLFAVETTSMFRRLVERGHQLISTHPQLVSEALNCPVAQIGDIELEEDDLLGRGIIRPWLWGEVPISAFERELRLIDSSREERLNLLRAKGASTL